MYNFYKFLSLFTCMHNYTILTFVCLHLNNIMNIYVSSRYRIRYFYIKRAGSKFPTLKYNIILRYPHTQSAKYRLMYRSCLLYYLSEDMSHSDTLTE